MLTVDWPALIASGDARAFSEAAEKVLGIPIPTGAFAQACFAHAAHWAEHGMPLGETQRCGWSDDTWRLWLKTHALRLRLYPATTPPQTPEPTVGTLHVGFVSIAETEEQLGRLRNDPEAIAEEVARSKIGKTQKAITPIDATAYRVAPPPHQGDESPA